MQLLYLEKLLRPINIMNVALNCWFSPYYKRILNAKMSLYYFNYLLFNLRFVTEQDLLQTIRLFISDWDGRHDCFRQLLSMIDILWNISVGYRGELSCVHLNRESHELIGAFLACNPDWAQGPPPSQCSRRYAPNAVCCCLVAGQYCTYRASSGDCWSYIISHHIISYHIS